MSNPICFALDVPSAAEAQRLSSLLAPHVGAFKIGLELFVAEGPSVIKAVQAEAPGVPIVLDLKLCDIPETVTRATVRACEHGVQFLTIHVQQGEAIERAVKVAEPFKVTLLGVTVLTSMDRTDMEDLRLRDLDPHARASALATFGWNRGLRGFVCSPKEIDYLSNGFLERGDKPFFLVPGVRPAGSGGGDDQKRVGTPSATVRAGANLIVIGRPIRDAKDPVEAAKAILEEVRS